MLGRAILNFLLAVDDRPRFEQDRGLMETESLIEKLAFFGRPNGREGHGLHAAE